MMATSLIYEPFKQLTEEMNQCCVSTQNNSIFFVVSSLSKKKTKHKLVHVSLTATNERI